MCCMSYLSAVTLNRQRTTRVSLLESMSFLGGFVGPFIGSALYEGAGRTWNFAALVIVNAAIVVYVVIFVPEVPPPRPPPASDTACQKLVKVSETDDWSGLLCVRLCDCQNFIFFYIIRQYIISLF